jgi:O-antigen ligase/tetratricopeptide (TPR) repeat protein
MEAVVLALVVLSPWDYGGVDPVAQFGLAVGIAVLLVLWLAVTLITGRVERMGGVVAFCLGGIAVLGFAQLLPLPPAVHRAVSPGSAELRRDLLPEQPEVFTADQAAPPAPTAWPFSIYPFVTRVDAVRWLAAFALFVVVRSQVANAASLRRLCMAVTINGALLALFGLAHRLSARPRHIFWTLETAGDVFGPFVYRNHYAAYTNLCLGLGVGLLLAMVQKRDRVPARGDPAPGFARLVPELSPTLAWLTLALALMLGGLVCSLSRGGVAALAVGGVTVLLLFQLWRPADGPRRLGRFVLPAVFLGILLVGLLALLGINPLETRLASLWTGDALNDERWRVWLNTLAIVPHFPIVGSGYGTLPFVEPIFRVRQYLPGALDARVFDYAHNDYLHALAEGGIVRLALTIGLVVGVLGLGVRAVRRQAGRPAGPLAVGALLAVATLSVHALFDFVIPVPAVAVLAAVTAAQLAALAGRTTDPSPARLGGPGRVAAVAGIATVCLVVVLQTRQAAQVYRLRTTAGAALRGPSADYDRAARLLADAIGAAPDNAEVRCDLGQLCLDARREILDGQRDAVRLAVAAGAPASAEPYAVAAAVLAWPDVREPAAAAHDTFGRLLVPGLRHLAEARQLCPVLPAPHLRFAAHAAELVRADPPTVYLLRARRLLPLDSDLWYVVGVQELRDGLTRQAWSSWRRSLELSDRRFDDVMTQVLAGHTGGVADAVGEVVPDDPDLLVRAALRLDPGGDAAAGGTARPLLERGLAVLSARPDARSAAVERLRARIHWLLGHDDEALGAYEAALSEAPNRLDWRQEYAGVLVEQERWDRAADELKIIIARAADAEAAAALKRVERERAIHARDLGRSGTGPRGVVDKLQTPASAGPGRSVGGDSDLPRAARQAAMAATVCVTNPRAAGVGSGVVVARTGNIVYLLTAAHLVPEVPEGDEVDVQFFDAADRPTPRGGAHRAQVKARVKDVDLAVLMAVAPDATGVLPVCPPAGTKGRRLPAQVLTVGCDVGGAPAAAVDRARAVRFVEQPYRANFFETDRAQAPGRSGGPLVDGRGYLIGVCSGTRGGRGYYVATSEIHHALRATGFGWIADGQAGADR